METTKLEVDRKEAWDALQFYENVPRDERSDEYVSIIKAYRWVLKGHSVLDLRQTMMLAGLDDDHFPRLAIVPADAEWCFYYRALRENNPHIFSPNPIDTWGTRHVTKRRVGLASHVLPTEWELREATSRHSAKALVPLVPPQHLPKLHLRNYHILFEAEWSPMPPVDPFLLKHIGGDLYSVIAEWDLTDIERAVIAGRLT